MSPGSAGSLTGTSQCVHAKRGPKDFPCSTDLVRVGKTSFSDKTILVVEDSPVLQHLIRASLAPLGPEIHQALDGRSGLASARQQRPDLVLLDIGLPILDGWSVLRQIRTEPEIANMSVVIVTAHGQAHSAAKAETDGANGFVAKPFRPEDLRQVVAEQLRHSDHALAAI